MDAKKSAPVTQADIRSLSEKTDAGLRSLSEKTDAGFRSLSEKTDAGFRSLSEKTDAGIARLAKQIAWTQAGMREMQKTMSTKSDIDRLIGVVDSFAGKAEASNRAVVLHGRALTETETSLRDHEKRLRAIEIRTH